METIIYRKSATIFHCVCLSVCWPPGSRFWQSQLLPCFGFLFKKNVLGLCFRWESRHFFFKLRISDYTNFVGLSVCLLAFMKQSWTEHCRVFGFSFLCVFSVFILEGSQGTGKGTISYLLFKKCSGLFIQQMLNCFNRGDKKALGKEPSVICYSKVFRSFNSTNV